MDLGSGFSLSVHQRTRKQPWFYPIHEQNLGVGDSLEIRATIFQPLVAFTGRSDSLTVLVPHPPAPVAAGLVDLYLSFHDRMPLGVMQILA